MVFQTIVFSFYNSRQVIRLRKYSYDRMKKQDTSSTVCSFREMRTYVPMYLCKFLHSNNTIHTSKLLIMIKINTAIIKSTNHRPDILRSEYVFAIYLAVKSFNTCRNSCIFSGFTNTPSAPEFNMTSLSWISALPVSPRIMPLYPRRRISAMAVGPSITGIW